MNGTNNTTTTATNNLIPTSLRYGISTTLLTLNIHEDLTFEGTEIVLHPEVFLSPHTNNNNSASNTSIGTSTSTSTTNTGSNASTSTSGSVNGNGASSILEINDLILIRVWDSKEKCNSSTTTNNNSDHSKQNSYNKESNTNKESSIPRHRRKASGSIVLVENDPTKNIHILKNTKKSPLKASKDDNDPLVHTHALRRYFVMRLTETSLSSLKGGGRVQISLLRAVADLYNVSAFDQVTVTKIDKQYEQQFFLDASADFVTIIFKDQFISRGDMFHFQNLLLGKLIYEGKRLVTDGIRGHAKSIQHLDEASSTGFVTPDTKIIFRSRSARIIWLVQLSMEMWDYVDPYFLQNKTTRDTTHTNSCCEIHFDTFVKFMYTLFQKWREKEVTHSLTVVFFSRTYWRMNSPGLGGQDGTTGGGSSPTKGMSQEMGEDKETARYVDIDGRLYEDHYKVIIENETRSDWETLVHTIKKEFIQYPSEVQWDFKNHTRIPSTASQGNILEAINVTLNLLQLHYMDRDLQRTGNSIVVCSAGSGVFEVDKNLASMTKQRMMDNGIGSDMLSLGLPPLHVAPFFLYKEVSEALQEESHGYDDWKTYFEIPHWMHLSFINYDLEVTEAKADTPCGTASNEVKDMAMNLKGVRTTQVEIGSNGFLIRTPTTPSSMSHPIPSSMSTVNTERICNTPKYRSSMQQRDLISGRDFNDILQACRPMYRGESTIALPSALKASLVTGASIRDAASSTIVEGDVRASTGSADVLAGREDDKSVTGTIDWTPFSLGTPLATNTRSVKERPQTSITPLMQLQEWGTVNFNEFCSTTTSQQAQQQQLYNKSYNPILSHDSPTWETSSVASYETTSPSSSFNSNFSYLLNRRCGNAAVASAIDEMNELHSSQALKRSLGGDTAAINPSFGGLQIQKPSSFDFFTMESLGPVDMPLKSHTQMMEKGVQEVRKEITPRKGRLRRNQSDGFLARNNQPRTCSIDGNEDTMDHTTTVPTTMNTATENGPDRKANLKRLMDAYDNQIFVSPLNNKPSTKQQLPQPQHLVSDSTIGNSTHSIQSIVIPSILDKNALDTTKSSNASHTIDPNTTRLTTEKKRVNMTKRSSISPGEGIGAALTNYNKYVNEARQLQQQHQDAVYLTYPPIVPNANSMEVQKARRKILELVNNSSSFQSMMMSRSPDKPPATSSSTLGRLQEHRTRLLPGKQVDVKKGVTAGGPTLNRLPDHVYSSGILNQYPYSVFFAPPGVGGSSTTATLNRTGGTPQPTPITVSHELGGISTASTKHHGITERTKLMTPTSATTAKKPEVTPHTSNMYLDSSTVSQRHKSNNAAVVSFHDANKTRNSDNKFNPAFDKQTHLKVAHQHVLKHVLKKHEHQSPSKKNMRNHHHHSKRHTSRSSASNMPLSSTATQQRKPWVLNPFRQRDETEILLRRTANRRRWSHVFPLGEQEFKRHSGPLWNSLCQPAVLPLTIDVFPSPKELNNTLKFQFNPYQITLDAMDITYYKSHTDLLEEMITQRLIQDFQIVPPSVVQSTKRAEVDTRKLRRSVKVNRTRRDRKNIVDVDTSSRDLERSRRGGGVLDVNDGAARHSSMQVADNALRGADVRSKEIVTSPKLLAPPTGFSRYMQNIATGDYDDPYSSSGSSVQCTLSMGHKIHIISYNPASNVIEVVQHTASFAQNDLKNTLTYNYMLWVPSIQKYTRVVQHFTKYANARFQWSYLDNLICGDPQKTLTEGTRFRRNIFCIIPENFADHAKEQEYVQKFQRLLDYLSKLQQNNDASSSSSYDKIDIHIVTSQDSFNDSSSSSFSDADHKKGRKQPRITEDVKNLIVPLRRKGGRNRESKFEWMELVMDGTFYTNRTYRIIVQWLVASANKVETQTQLLQRRCTQYGLHLVYIPQSSISSNPFLHPFISPPCIPVRDKEKAILVEEALTNKFHFIHEGIRYTYPQFLHGIDQFNFRFGNTTTSKILKEVVPGRQYIHPTGGVFVRVLKDGHGWAIFILMRNRNLTTMSYEVLKDLERTFINEFCKFIHDC